MKTELKQMLSGKGFGTAVFLGVLGIAAGIDWVRPKNLPAAGNFLTLYKNALCSKTVCYLVPVVSTLPWSDSFLREYNSGFLKTVLPRQGRRHYVENKLLGVAVSGFLVWALAGLAGLFLDFILFFPAEQQGRIPLSVLWEALEILGRISVLGAVLASLGGICAALWNSGYLAFGIPLTGWYFCMILKERYFPDVLWIYPAQWIAGTADWGGNGEGLWIFLLLFLEITAGIHGAVLYGRIGEI